MGSSGSTYTDEEVIAQLQQNDPIFEYQKYIDADSNLTLQDVMNIRSCFMQLRDEYVDPPEMIKVRKLRCFEFLTNEEIL